MTDAAIHRADAAKGPAAPLPGFRGTRFDPPWAWLFGRGVYGPPDNRMHPRLGRTYEQERAMLATFAGATPTRVFKWLYGRDPD